MYREPYERADLEIILLQTEDVVLTSEQSYEEDETPIMTQPAASAVGP